MDKQQGVMVVAEDRMYSMDSRKTKLNNNVLVVGASGSGKTRGIVSPNILLATGSYIISDPKGNLYHKYEQYLRSMGYEVKKIDFTDPMNSSHYNFLNYTKEPRDIYKAAHVIANQEICTRDPFWDQTATMLLTAMISYVLEFCRPDEHNFKSIEKLLQLGRRCDENISSSLSGLDKLMNQAEMKYPNSYAIAQYKNVAVAPDKTFDSILISLTSKLREFSSEEISYMMSSDEVDIVSIGQRKTALFVVVSDTDRSLDTLANLFFTQAINELCRYADKECKDNTLPVPVRFILDDFATNCIIGDFPRMISSIRSRGISTMLMIQSEAQLGNAYGYDKETVIGNCDTYVYLGGSDIETARRVSERADIPLKKILNLPVGTAIIFRRGEPPVIGRGIDLEKFEKDFGYTVPVETKEQRVDTKTLREKLRGKAEKKEENIEMHEISPGRFVKRRLCPERVNSIASSVGAQKNADDSSGTGLGSDNDWMFY